MSSSVSTIINNYFPRGDDMSMLALFYTLPTDQLEALIESSKPVTHKVEKGFLG